MTRHTLRRYIPGDHLVICDRCGKKRYRSDTRKEWQGWLVCIDTCWEIRHPQDLTPPYRLDRQWVDDNRPRVTDPSTISREFVSQDFTTFTEVDASALLAVAATQLDLSINTQQDAKLYKFYGEEYFLDDFRIRFTLDGSGADANNSNAFPVVLSQSQGFGTLYYPDGGLVGLGVLAQIASNQITLQIIESDGLGNSRIYTGTIVVATGADTFYEFKREGVTVTLERYADGTFATVAESISQDQYDRWWFDYMVCATISQSSPLVSSATLTVKDLLLYEEVLTPILPGDL